MGLFSGPRERTGGRSARQLFGITGAGDLIPPRPFQRSGAPVVTHDSALRHSAVWACLRQRADLISTFPVDVFRRVAGMQYQCPVPPVLQDPDPHPAAGGDTGLLQWLYSSQMDLDRAGNAIGLIRQRDGFGLPSRIELAPATQTAVIVKNGRIDSYRINGSLYDPSVIWHERAYTVPGLFVGLSPVAYAAWAIGEYMSVQEFATDWFTGGAVPRARLRNTAKTLDSVEALKVKEAWRASISAGEPFVHGNDWEYDLLQAVSASSDWIEAKKFSITDIARFFGVPSDLIDSAPTGVSRVLTYANISQRNLQLLIMNLGPAIIRREAALSRLLVKPRYVKFNTDALLRLDPQTRAQAIQTQIDSRVLAPSEARELDNRPPFTTAQEQEFYTLFGYPVGGVPGMPAAGGADGPDAGQGEIDPGGGTPPAIGPGD